MTDDRRCYYQGFAPRNDTSRRTGSSSRDLDLPTDHGHQGKEQSESGWFDHFGATGQSTWTEFNL